MSKDPKILGGKRRKPKRMVALDKFWYDHRMFNAIIYGSPRSGKSVLLANFLNVFKGLGFNVFVNDCAKGYDLAKKRPKSEILMYFSDQLEFINKEVRIFVPPECSVDIPTRNYEIVEVGSFDELFNHLKPDKLNIISFESFILPPLALARFWALFSIELLYRSKRAELYTPILGALDQINHIFPSSALRFSHLAGTMQDKAANWFARFLMDCSGSGVKMLATSHGITMVKKVVRMNFHWKFFKQFSEDITLAVSRIRPAQKLIESLDVMEVYATDDQHWGDRISDIPNVPFEPETVHYTGKFVKDPYWVLDSEHLVQVLTPAEYRKLQKLAKGGELDEFTKRIQAGLFFLTGRTYNELMAEFEVSRPTINSWLDFCRNIFPFSVIEKYRYNIQKMTEKSVTKGLRDS